MHEEYQLALREMIIQCSAKPKTISENKSSGRFQFHKNIQKYVQDGVLTGNIAIDSGVLFNERKNLELKLTKVNGTGTVKNEEIERFGQEPVTLSKHIDEMSLALASLRIFFEWAKFDYAKLFLGELNLNGRPD